MGETTDILSRIRRAAKQRLLFLPHAVNQMMRPERMITIAEVRSVVEKGEVIEEYPEDPRGNSCLMLYSYQFSFVQNAQNFF